MPDPMSHAAFQAAVEASDALAPVERLRRLDELGSTLWQFTPKPPQLEALLPPRLAAACEAAVEVARRDAGQRAALIELVEKTWFTEGRIALLGRLRDEETFALVQTRVEEQLQVAYYDCRPAWFFALADLAQEPAFAARATATLCGGVEKLAERARAEESLVNSVGMNALAFSLALLPGEASAKALQQAWQLAVGKVKGLKSHYELKLTLGPIALGLAAVAPDDHSMEAAFAAFLEDFEWRYPGDTFIVQVRYAQWLSRRDGAGALAYLTDPKNTKSLGLVAAALADLHHVAAVPALEALRARLENPVAREAVDEALWRLRTQAAAPAPRDRMIWLFGRSTSTEEALGGDSDNVFLLRARARTRDDELGRVTETDDSAPDDV